MKARLAKKIAHTPVGRLSPRWLDRFLGGDKRINETRNGVKRDGRKGLSVYARNLKNPMSCWINWSARNKKKIKKK